MSYHTLLRFISHLRVVILNVMPVLLKKLSHVVTSYHALSHIITPYPLCSIKKIFSLKTLILVTKLIKKLSRLITPYPPCPIEKYSQ